MQSQVLLKCCQINGISGQLKDYCALANIVNISGASDFSGE